MEKKLYELPTIVIFDLDKNDTIRTSLELDDILDFGDSEDERVGGK